MTRYYIKDKTVNMLVYKNNVREVVQYLEGLCVRLHKRTRKSYMDEMISIGYGYDDNDGQNFAQLLSNDIDMGRVLDDGRLKRCSIHEYARTVRYKDEMGD